jgi:hypothetical protein
MLSNVLSGSRIIALGTHIARSRAGAVWLIVASYEDRDFGALLCRRPARAEARAWVMIHTRKHMVGRANLGRQLAVFGPGTSKHNL